MVSVLVNVMNKRGRNFYTTKWTFIQEERTNIITIKRGIVIVSIINADHKFSIKEAKHCIMKQIKKFGGEIYSKSYKGYISRDYSHKKNIRKRY